MRKLQAIDIISRAANIYDKQLNQKNLLIIFGSPSKPEFIETQALQRNFLHLTGIELNKNIKDNTPEQFYLKAINHKINENDFEFKDITTEQKLNVLLQTLMVATNAKMVGDYNYNASHINLQTDKLAGGVNSCMGFFKVNDYYVPNTVLATDIRKETTNRQKVLAVLSKNIEDEKYNTIKMVNKKIDIGKLIEKVSQSIPIDIEIMSDKKQSISQMKSPQVDNIKQIKFDNPTPQNIVHNNSGTVAAVLPAPNPFKNLISSLKNLFKKQNKPTAISKEVEQTEKDDIPEAEVIVEQSNVSKEMSAMIEAREAFAAGNLSQEEYQKSVRQYLYSLHGKEEWTEAAEALHKQLDECPNMSRFIGYELKCVEVHIEKHYTPQPKQTLDEIKRAAREYIKQQNENKSAAKETSAVKDRYER